MACILEAGRCLLLQLSMFSLQSDITGLEVQQGHSVSRCCPVCWALTFLQVTFNWTGFWSAMGSNLTFQSRNVLSKKMMSMAPSSSSSSRQGSLPAKPLDNMNLFAIIQVMSFLLLAPITLLREGMALAPDTLASMVGHWECYALSQRCMSSSRPCLQADLLILVQLVPLPHAHHPRAYMIPALY